MKIFSFPLFPTAKKALQRLMVICFAFIYLFTNNNLKAQNAIVGTGFSSGWGNACVDGSDYTYFSYPELSSGELAPHGTGNQYWRFAVGWGSVVKQLHLNNTGTNVEVFPNTTYTLNSNCVNNGAMFTNVSSTNNRYIFKTRDAGETPTGDFVMFALSGAAVSVNAVSQSPVASGVQSGQAVTVTATLSGALPGGQGVWLRYTTDNFATSYCVPFSGSGTSYTGIIPGSANTSGANIVYYIFTSGTPASISGADAGFYTINGNYNNGSNYSYTVNISVGGPLINTSGGIVASSPGAGTSGYVGNTVAIHGSNLNAVTTVKVGGGSGTAVSIISQTATQITFMAVNAGGAVYVDGPGGNALSSETYTNLGYITQASGNYTVNSTWFGNTVPPAGASVTIANSSVYTISAPNAAGMLTVNTGAGLALGTNFTATSVVNNGALSCSAATNLNITAGGAFTNNTGATFTAGTDTVSFGGIAAINGTQAITFNNLTLNGASTFTTVPTINGVLTLNSADAILSAAPYYGGSSKLLYNTHGFTFVRGPEWSSNSGAGYPAEVQLSNNSTLNPAGNTGSAALNIAGDLTIDAGSAIYLDYGGQNMIVPLTINGNMILNGNISGSQNSGGYIIVKGNWTFGSSSNFYPNSRKVVFNGSSNQNISGANNSLPSFYQVEINNTAGVTLMASQSIGSNLTLTNGLLKTGAYNLTINSGGSTTGGTATSYVQTNSTGRLIQTVGASNTFYPVGRSAFNPITLNNSGTSDTYGVYVVDVTTSPAANNNTKLVNRYWNINEGTSGGSNLSIKVQWNSPGEENANFAAGVVPKIGLYSGSWSEQEASAGTGTIAGAATLTSNTNFAPLNITGGATIGAGVDNAFSQALPSISGFTPSTGYVSTPVVITGANLGSVTGVTFGGVPATSFTINSSTQITATVGAGASGSVAVVNPSGSASRPGFIYSGYVTVQNGSYTMASTWITNTVPPAGAVVTIAHAVTISAVANAAASLTINSGASLNFNSSNASLTAATVTNNGTLSWSAAGALNIGTSGALTNNATFTPGTGTVIFNGTGTSTVSGTITFNNVTIKKGVDFGLSSTVTGTLEIGLGSYIINNAPVYATGATLSYNTGGHYQRSYEWSTTSGRGYPYNVRISSGLADIKNNSSSAAACAGNLTILTGAELTMNNMPTSLTVSGSILNSGTLTLSTVIGGDLYLYNNLTDNGTFNANNRAIFFAGANAQSIGGNNIFDIPYVRVNKTGGSVKMLTDLVCAGPGGGNAMELSGSTSVLDLNGHQLTLGLAGVASTYNSGVATTGFIKGSNISSIIVNGTGALGTLKFDQTTDGTTNVLKSITINRTSSGTATLGNKLVIKNTLTPANGTLNAAGFLYLRSDINNTAQVAAGSTSGGYVSGNVTVERYIPAYGHRAWMMLAVPTGGSQTIKDAWQEGQAPLVNGVPGYGTIITGTTGTANGFDATTAGNSLLAFTSGNPGSWSGVASTSNAISNAQHGYMLYMRGDRTSSPYGGPVAQSATTLRTTGTLYQGDQGIITLPAGANVFVGNPYASAIDFAAMTVNGNSSFKLWDPKLAGSTGLGAYQTFSSVNGYQPTPGGGSYGNAGNSRIESGQAFIVNSTNGGSLTITEASKVSGSRNNVFRTSHVISQFKTNLYAIDDVSTNLTDGTTAVFDESYSNAVDNNDALKAINIGENISIQKNGVPLAIETRRPVSSSDTLNFKITNLKKQAYKLEFIASNLNDEGLTANLEDKYLGTTMQIDLADTTSVNFKITTDAASYSQDRFKIVFKSKAASPIKVTGGKSKFTVTPNPVEGGRINIAFTNKQAGNYILRLINTAGDIFYTTTIKHSGEDCTKTFQIPQVANTGLYNLELISPNNNMRNVQEILIIKK